MKENKYGIVIALTLTTISLLGALVFSFGISIVWLQNLFFAILGGSLCSLIIFVVNYKISVKRCALEIVETMYNFNHSSYSNIFSTNNDANLEKIMKVLGIMDNIAYIVYTKSYEISHTLFFNKFIDFKIIKNLMGSKESKILLAKEVNCLIKQVIKDVQEIAIYIEKYTEEAQNKTKKIYKKVDKLIDSDEIFLLSIKLANMLHCNVHSLQEKNNAEELKTKTADKFRETL